MFGSNGVNLFFAISGFLITLGLLKAKATQPLKVSLIKFYIRRFLRIFPIYYLLLSILWVFDRSVVENGIWWYLCYMANFYSIKIQNWGGVGHLWSLSIEEQFYFVWPFLILLSPVRLLPLLFATTICLSILFKIYIIHIGAPWWIFYMNPLGVLDILSLGALLSYLYYFHPIRLKSILYNRIWIALIFSQACLMFYFRFTEHYFFIYDIFNRLSFGIFSIWLIGRAIFGFDGIIGYILNLRILRYIGKISYGVYIFHPFIPDLFSFLKYPSDSLLRFMIYFLLTILVSSFSWYFFESRILKLKEKFE